MDWLCNKRRPKKWVSLTRLKSNLWLFRTDRETNPQCSVGNHTHQVHRHHPTLPLSTVTRRRQKHPSSYTRYTGSSQDSRRVYPFSSTAIIHVRIPVNKNNTEVPRYASAKSYLASLNYVTLFSPQRDYCCLVGLILNWYTVRMMSRVGLHWGNKTWCFMTHGMNKGPWVFSLILIEILLPSSPGHQCIHNEVNRISKYDLRTFTKC